MHQTCQNCQKKFLIDQQDQDFYEKINVPNPTWCPTCRLMRRLNFLNWFTLYKRTCASCGETMIASIHEGNPLRVFCAKCWWADTWDGTEYAMDYDETRPFLEQMMELRNKSTFMSNESLYSSLVNSPYVNATAYQKDCYMVFNADYGERNAYCLMYAHATECLDGYRLKNCELCFECTGMYKSYGCSYSEELDSCSNVSFSRSCSGCTDCFGCINLRNKSNCIFNVQYTKEEYKEKLEAMQLDTRAGVERAYAEVLDFWAKHPRRATEGNSLNINTTGDFVYESKNTQNGYMITSTEDSRYVQLVSIAPVKGCYDYTNWGNGAENLYECLTVGEGAYGNKFCVQCWPNAINNEYCFYTIQSKDCFGCVNLKRKQYCILNKEYTKEEYFKLKEKIIESMKKDPYIDTAGRIWKYGELLPLDFSPFAYNETIAHYFFPLTKQEADTKKLRWFDIPQSDHAITMKHTDLAVDVASIQDDITREIIECAECGKGYRFVDLELMLLRKMKMPLSPKCWKCRFKRRFDRVNKPYLYDRTCDKCDKTIQSSYAPDRPEIVYCESCYQQEIH